LSRLWKADEFDGLYIGRRKGKDRIYAGKVDHGFDNASAKDLQARLRPLIRKTQPYVRTVRTAEPGSNRRYRRKSNTAPSRPKGRSDTLSSRASGEDSVTALEGARGSAVLVQTFCPVADARGRSINHLKRRAIGRVSCREPSFNSGIFSAADVAAGRKKNGTDNSSTRASRGHR
jgi:hypothetical protein